MVRLNVLELLQQRGHTKYWLYKQLGMSYQNFNKMVNNQTASIRYENIEAICQLLECTPNELFRFEEDEPDRNPTKSSERIHFLSLPDCCVITAGRIGTAERHRWI